MGTWGLSCNGEGLYELRSNLPVVSAVAVGPVGIGVVGPVTAVGIGVVVVTAIVVGSIGLGFPLHNVDGTARVGVVAGGVGHGQGGGVVDKGGGSVGVHHGGVHSGLHLGGLHLNILDSGGVDSGHGGGVVVAIGVGVAVVSVTQGAVQQSGISFGLGLGGSVGCGKQANKGEGPHGAQYRPPC